MKHILSFLLICCACSLQAQTNIVEHLREQKAGQGTVTVHQDPKLSALIGKIFAHSEQSRQGSDRAVIKTRGYRVQVYAGNNSRAARNQANAVAGRVKSDFPEYPVYTYFLPPRWLCRVGDFRSIEEADVAMRKLKQTGMYKEVSIVREQINIHLD